MIHHIFGCSKYSFTLALISVNPSWQSSIFMSLNTSAMTLLKSTRSKFKLLLILSLSWKIVSWTFFMTRRRLSVVLLISVCISSLLWPWPLVCHCWIAPIVTQWMFSTLWLMFLSIDWIFLFYSATKSLTPVKWLSCTITLLFWSKVTTSGHMPS